MPGTTLNPGDIAFLNIDSGHAKSANDAGDTQFSFVTLTALAAGTAINFTDRGWNGTAFQTGSSATNDGTVTFTATSAISAGTIVVVARDVTKGGYTTLNEAAMSTPTDRQEGYAIATTGTVAVTPSDATGNFDVGNDGQGQTPSADQIFAYQGSDTSPAFIAAIATGSFTPAGTAISDTDPTQSQLPKGLTAGDTAIVLNDVNAAYFNGTLSGTAAQIRAELNNPGSYQEAGIAYNTADGSIVVQPGSPTITGTAGNQTTTAEAATTPFQTVTITDPNNGATDTVTLTFTGPGGALTGPGLTRNPDGSYTLAAASPATVTSELDALTFTPVAGAPNTSSITTFTIAAASSAGPSTADSTTSVIDTDPAVPPTITGMHETATTSEAAVNPFSGVSVLDRNAGATDAATITLTGMGGVVTGAGLTANADGSYTLGPTSAADLTAEIDALRFTPNAGAAGTSSTTGLSIAVASSSGSTVTGSGTSVIDTDPPASTSTPDAITVDQTVGYDGRGTFTLTGFASSAVGVKGVEFTALLNGQADQPVDLGAATLNADGTFTFSDPTGGRLQGFITATETDGAGVQTQADFSPALQGGKAPHMDRYTVTPTDVVYTGSTSYKRDGSESVTVTASGQTLTSNFFDTFQNNGSPETTFVFDPGHGLDIVKQFRVDGDDHDTISLPSPDFAGIADVLANSHNAKGGVVITDPTSGDTVKLTGISKQQLTANQGDFAFHA